MIRIRYAELPAGLHVIAETDRRGTVVYLLPGLTPAQRRAALVRVRRSARMGHGPRLAAVPMAGAVAADRVRTNMQNATAAMRRHPILFLPPLVVLVSTAIVFTLMSFAPLPAASHGTAPAGAPPLKIDDRPSATASGHASHSTAPVGVPTPGIGTTPSAAPSHHVTRTSKKQHGLGSASRKKRHLPAASPALSPGSPVAAGSPSPSPAPTQFGSADGMCHTFGSRNLCVGG